jgi:hypothetical protein
LRDPEIGQEAQAEADVPALVSQDKFDARNVGELLQGGPEHGGFEDMVVEPDRVSQATLARHARQLNFEALAPLVVGGRRVDDGGIPGEEARVAALVALLEL